MYAFQRLYAPVRNLARMNNELRTLQGATERVFGILKTIPDIRDAQGSVELPRHSKSIELKDVSFSFEPGVPVLRGISVSIKAGEMVAFVGSTGAGKSTLLDLVPRFYDVTSGSIAIDGFDVRQVTLDSLRRQISIVSQEVLLFHDTITNNIRYAPLMQDGGGDRQSEASPRSRFHTGLTRRGVRWREIRTLRRQRQRIAIARAI
jgi:subfamily B ATP-binding cassette protein MsbA